MRSRLRDCRDLARDRAEDTAVAFRHDVGQVLHGVIATEEQFGVLEFQRLLRERTVGEECDARVVERRVGRAASRVGHLVDVALRRDRTRPVGVRGTKLKPGLVGARRIPHADVAASADRPPETADLPFAAVAVLPDDDVIIQLDGSTVEVLIERQHEVRHIRHRAVPGVDAPGHGLVDDPRPECLVRVTRRAAARTAARKRPLGRPLVRPAELNAGIARDAVGQELEVDVAAVLDRRRTARSREVPPHPQVERMAGEIDRAVQLQCAVPVHVEAGVGRERHDAAEPKGLPLTEPQGAVARSVLRSRAGELKGFGLDVCVGGHLRLETRARLDDRRAVRRAEVGGGRNAVDALLDADLASERGERGVRGVGDEHARARLHKGVRREDRRRVRRSQRICLALRDIRRRHAVLDGDGRECRARKRHASGRRQIFEPVRFTFHGYLLFRCS